MARTRVLLAGESWVSAAVHHKGWDHFGSVTFHLGAEPLVAALADSPFDLHYMPAHEAATRFPLTLEGLEQYGAVILSDLGSNTLLLHPDVWLTGKPVANRLKLLREYVRAGGGLMMIGGYYSFQGINGGARYHRTAVEEVLPVDCLPYDDRIEVPEGFRAEIVGPGSSDPGGAGRRMAASPRRERGQAQGTSGRRSCSRACRRPKAATRCSRPALTAAAARSPGPPTSALTGCPRPLPSGRATLDCGGRRSRG